MKTRNKKLFFWSAFILLCMAFICVLPIFTDTFYYWQSSQGFDQSIKPLYDFFWYTEYVSEYSNFIDLHIEDYHILIWIVILANIAGVKSGFDCYKKKWWYYLMILISFIMSCIIFESRNGIYDSV